MTLGVRAQQKEKTRRALIDAAFSQLSAEKNFSSISLREVSRQAGIAPTSFYRHFSDMNELGLTMVDEAGLTLRQLMRQARERIAKGGSVIHTSVDTFMEFIEKNSNVFRLLLHERSGTSKAFRMAVYRENQHFIAELADYLSRFGDVNPELARIEADALVTVVFNAGAEALDSSREERKALSERTKAQLRMVTRGALLLSKKQSAEGKD